MNKSQLEAEAYAQFQAHGAPLDPARMVTKATGFIAEFLRQGVEEDVHDLGFNDGFEFGRTDDRVHLTIPAYLERIPAQWKADWRGREIPVSAWKPALGYSDEITPVMREFILSPIPRFDRLIPNLEFFLYVEQARRWHEETKDIEMANLEPDEAVVFMQKELERMTDNSLYALNRYVRVREDQYPDGRIYEAGCPQAYLCYWIDRGNNVSLLKGRQAAITTTVMAVMCIKMLMVNSWTGVLLTDDKIKTGEDLFDKKVMGTMKLLPEWLTQDWLWDRAAKDNVTADFRDDNMKSSRRRNYSDLLLLGSDDSQAVNSKSPSITCYDEAQNIPKVAKISKEVKPTQYSEINGKLLRVRQQLMWGTGTSNPAGKGIWLKDWRGLLKATMAGEQTDGWIVIFFDWTCRPKADLAWYMKERAAALQKYRFEGDESALHIFASACPSSPDDAFMENHKSAVPAAIIKRHRDRLTNLADDLRPVKGIFQPVYDLTAPTPKGGHADHPYRISGAVFVPAKTSLQMLNAPVEMYSKPNNLWLDRNFMGTDPIQSATGRSKHSSAIWDAVGYHHDGNGFCPAEGCGIEEEHFHPRLACVVNGRTGNVKEMYTQSALMNMHYHNYGKRGCRELIEWNQGQLYIEYLQFDWIGLRRELLTKAELLEAFQAKSAGSAASIYGMQMTPDKKSKLLNIMEDLVSTHGKGIMHLSFWNQLAEIELEEVDGKKTWGTRDLEQFNDDIVVSTLLAKLCCDSVGKKPRLFNSADAPKQRTRRVYDHQRTPMGLRLIEREERYDVNYR